MSPAAEALALRVMATAFDALRDHLPSPDPPDRNPDLITISHLVSDFGRTVSDLSDEVLFRAANDNPSDAQQRAMRGFGATMPRAGRALDALATVYQELVFLHWAGHQAPNANLRDGQQDARRVIREQFCEAHDALCDAATGLRLTADRISSPTPRCQAAHIRSPQRAATAGTPPPALPPAPAATPDPRGRGR